jgi:hypothetical protein
MQVVVVPVGQQEWLAALAAPVAVLMVAVAVELLLVHMHN